MPHSTAVVPKERVPHRDRFEREILRMLTLPASRLDARRLRV
jgi:hypothetical protein